MIALERGSIVGAAPQKLVVEECGFCCVLFALPMTMREVCIADHSRGFYCPNGHKLFYQDKTEAMKLREQLERERLRSGNLAAQRDQVKASLRATKGVVTRMKRRSAAGVCPCCGRTFQQLARHMEAKHPDYAVESVAE